MTLSERHAGYLTPKGEIDARLAGLRSTMQAEDLALVWIEHLADRLYFTGSAQDGVLLVPARGKPALHVRKSRSRAEAESRVPVHPHPGGKPLLSEAREGAGGGRVGLAMDVTPAATLLRLQRTLEPGALVDVSPALRWQRAVKSGWEVEQMRAAAAHATTIMREAPEQLRSGRSELEVSGWAEGRLRALGHPGTVRVRRPGSEIPATTIVSGPSSFYPTNFNGPDGAEGPYPSAAAGGGWKRLAEGESVMLDIVTCHNGYHADTTRCFFLGPEVPEAARRAHELCREVLRRIETSLRPGAICSEVYREALRFAEAKAEPQGFMGYGENRVRFFGHGVGLELDEMPVLAEKIDRPIETGMILAVEPKAFLDGIGPVGLENTYVVTERGGEPLCEIEDALRSV